MDNLKINDDTFELPKKICEICGNFIDYKSYARHQRMCKLDYEMDVG